MTRTTLKALRPEKGPLSTRLRAIPGLRRKVDEDGSWIAVSVQRSRRHDKVCIHSKDLLCLYFERDTVKTFCGAARKYRQMLGACTAYLGDQDGLMYFPWGAATKLVPFFKKRRKEPK